jgi:hypothetical protein
LYKATNQEIELLANNIINKLENFVNDDKLKMNNDFYVCIANDKHCGSVLEFYYKTDNNFV